MCRGAGIDMKPVIRCLESAAISCVYVCSEAWEVSEDSDGFIYVAGVKLFLWKDDMLYVLDTEER